MTLGVKCFVCHRKAAGGGKYCVHHAQALKSLNEHYNAWVKAYGAISWPDFTSKLLSMDETGSWIKEVIQAERRENQAQTE